MNLSAEEIENNRKILKAMMPPAVANELCALALDGLKFRAWVDGCAKCPGTVAVALGPCVTRDSFRRAIEGLIASGKIRP